MASINLKLKQIVTGGGLRAAQAVYDLDSGELSGPDADLVGEILSDAQATGYANPYPCTKIPLPPPGTPLTPDQLSAVLIFFWDVSATDLPPHAVPEDWDTETEVELLN